MLGRSTIVLALLLAACGDQRTVTDLENEERELPDFTRQVPPVGDRPIVRRPLDLEDPDIERAGCEPGPDAPAFRMLSAASSEDAMLGSCGELAWHEAGTGALHFAGVDEDARLVDEAGYARWVGGNRLLYAREEAVVLDETGAAPRSWAAPGAFLAAPIPGTDAFWACSADNGIERLDADGISFLTPDFIQGLEFTFGCWSIDVSDGGAIAYPTDDHRIGVVQTATGARERIDLAFYPDGSVDDEERERMDVVQLGPDASFVLHEKHWLEWMGDAIGPVGEGEVTIATAAEPAANRLPGMLGDAWVFLGTEGWDWMGPWMGSAPGVLLPTWGGAHLVGVGETRSFDGFRPKAIRGNHVFGETKSGAGLVELGNGRLHELFAAPGLEHVVPYRWGGPVAFSHFTRACIRYPDRPDTCHAQIWGVSVWDAVRGARRVAFGTQPLRVLAIGPAGEVVLAGRLLDGPPPDAAEPRAIEPRIAVFGADGELVHSAAYTEFTSGIGGAHFAVIERQRSDDTSRWSELVRIDWVTGDEEILVTGRFIEAWALDHSDRRVSALVIPDGDRVPAQLWSGVVGP